MLGLGLIILILAIIFVVTTKSIKIVPEARVFVIERLGK